MIKIDGLREEELIEFINEKIINENTSKKTKNNKIQNHKIFSLTNEFSTYIKIISYIENKGIKIEDNTFFTVDTTYNGNTYISHTKEEQLINEYINTKDKKIEKILFEKNLPSAAFVAYKYGYLRGYDPDEMYIAAQEGLFTAIQNYNPNKNGRFSSYCKLYILRGLHYNHRSLNIASNYVSDIIRKEKEQVEEDYLVKLNSADDENYKYMVNHIVNKLVNDGVCTENLKPRRLCRIDIENALNIENTVSIQDINENELVIQNDYLKPTLKKEMLKLLKEILSSYIKNEEKFNLSYNIILDYYGLVDNSPKTYSEISKKYNLSVEAIRRREKNTINKIKKHNKVKVLKEYLKY